MNSDSYAEKANPNPKAKEGEFFPLGHSPIVIALNVCQRAAGMICKSSQMIVYSTRGFHAPKCSGGGFNAFHFELEKKEPTLPLYGIIHIQTRDHHILIDRYIFDELQQNILILPIQLDMHTVLHHIKTRHPIAWGIAMSNGKPSSAASIVRQAFIHHTTTYIRLGRVSQSIYQGFGGKV
ncbi:uncharacterized protein EI90DRAFT_3016199 [Cantharellus anzutake]|uniref:uncharacterized protein n=1 Tax=Cantharellus anzutake TaxID=1750568 RepID=UPI0019075081|nr:uncharacterized protein EI90DRAFT_3016199 [Cantharellus anzutake]KAF8332123.1 hypothetical protein EI90DRAFT_3016199 [Cantharellus anzutake]